MTGIIAGNIILLNGTSSSGKTTLAHTLQEILDEPYLHIALDQFRDGMPGKYRGLNAPEGTTGAAGLNVVPMRKRNQTVTQIRFGNMGIRMLCGMRRAIAALAQAGNNLIIDDIIFTPDFLDDYLNVLGDFTVYFVAVLCPEKVLSQRESARPGRFPGTASGQLSDIHQACVYDVEVDTSLLSPRQCADRVVEYIASNKTPAAFHSLRNARRL